MRKVQPVTLTQQPPNLPVYTLPDERPGWRIMLALALGLVLLYFVTARPLEQGDAATRNAFALTAALATERRVTIDHFVRSATGSFLSSPADYTDGAYYQGHYYTATPPGISLLAVPFCQIGSFIGSLFTTLAPQSNALSEAPATLSLFMLALLGGGIVIMVYALARKLGSAEASARYAALTLGLASALWRETGHFGPAALSLLLLLAILYIAFPDLPNKQIAGKKAHLGGNQSLLIGLLLGLAVVVDYPNLAWTPLLLIYLFWAKRLRPTNLPELVGGWIIGIAPLLCYNWAIFGLPWAFTYGHLWGNPEARSFGGQFLSGFSFDNLRQIFLGNGRALFGPFLIFFGTWGLVALYGQRGKHKETLLLIWLIVVSLGLSLLRRPVGEGVARIDFSVGVMAALVVGVAVWHERFQFLTRLEQTWLPLLALWGIALYYYLAGPRLHNLDKLPYLLPLLAVGLIVGLIWWAGRIPRKYKGLTLAGGITLFALVNLLTIQPHLLPYVYFPGETSNLIYNGRLQCQGEKLPGWYLSEPCQTSPYGQGGIIIGAKATLQPYLIPVQGGKVYNQMIVTDATDLSVTWNWSEEGHNPLPGEFSRHWNNLTGVHYLNDWRAAPPGAAYLQL
ncbi:MAG: hypothetical protein WCS37_13015, partial [Chloroflexota bacterium]